MEAKKMTIRMWHGCAIVAALLVVAGIARGGFGSGPGFGPGPELSPEQELARLQSDFALSDEQSAEVAALLKTRSEQHQEILAAYGLSPERFQALEEDLHMNMKDFFTSLRAILTDGQKKRFMPLGDRMGGHRPPFFRPEE